MDRLLTLPPQAASTSLVGEPFAVPVPARRGALTRAPPPEPASASPLAGRITLAHDYLLVMRGAERTFAAIADLYAQAPIFALLHDEPGTNGRFSGRSITTSPLQRLGIGQSTFRRLL